MQDEISPLRSAEALSTGEETVFVGNVKVQERLAEVHPISSSVEKEMKDLQDESSAAGGYVTAPLADTGNVQRSPSAAFDALDAATRQKIEDLLSYHYIFEAYALCPEYVEAQGYLKKYREATELLVGAEGQRWEEPIEGDLGDGDKWKMQFCWDGLTPNSGGNEYLWVKLSIDQGIEWWKQLGGFQEPDLDMKGNPILADARMIGKPAPTYSIRCNIQGFFGKLFGYTQDYLEVRRYINKETGFNIESNTSIEHEELERRGYDVGKKKYKKGNDMLLYVISFPRAEQKCTCILYTRAQIYLPTRLVNMLMYSVGPKLVKKMLPKLVEDQRSNPEYQARFAEDKQGLYAYFKDFSKCGVSEAAKRPDKYSASNLPPPDVVMGRFYDASNR